MQKGNSVDISICESHNHEADDPTAPFNEVEAFNSIWEALKWKHIRARVPVCLRKTLRSRYMLANLVYLGYAIGILIIDFNPQVNGSADSSSVVQNNTYTTPVVPTLEQSISNTPLVNRLYLEKKCSHIAHPYIYIGISYSLQLISGFAIVHIVSAFLYWWAWAGRSWLDVIMIPEYLNHIEAGLYLWSANWYPKADTMGSYYTLAVHKIELTAAIVELFASFG
ncbi:unnamed protein product, partial [Rotaria socialis]